MLMATGICFALVFLLKIKGNDCYRGTRIKSGLEFFHSLAQTHNEACMFDIALMTSLLEKDVKLTGCMTKGSGACWFNIIDKYASN
jgi:hypothetical protein